MFSDEFTFGFPPSLYALDAHLALLSEVAAGAPWLIAGLGVDGGPLVKTTIARGGHLRTGLEDLPFGTTQTNADLVANMARQVRHAGREPATAAAIRGALTHTDP